MRITESQLRRIIRQERTKLTEALGVAETSGSMLIDFAEAYAALGGAVRDQVAAVVEAYLSSNGDPEDPIFQDAVDAQNPAALQMAHERLKGFLLGGDLGDEGDAVGDALELAVQLQSMYRGA